MRGRSHQLKKMKLPKYYKRSWEETRGNEYEKWGKSIWYFEIDNEGYAMRQIEKYENGKKLKYDLKNIEDEFGGLADQLIDLEEFVNFEITKDEFEEQWK